MQILKSVLWSFTFFPMTILGQFAGTIFGDLLYFMYSLIAVAIPEFMFVIGPWMLGGVIGGVAAAWIINKYAQPVSIISVSLLPGVGILLASMGSLVGFTEHTDLSRLIGQMGANFATFGVFFYRVRERLKCIGAITKAPKS